MKVRLIDIAKRLNVSANTVSRALHGGDDIGEATRQRVLELAKQLDYQPNLAARSLVTGHSSIVGLIVPDLLNPFYAELAKSISGALYRQSKSLILASSEKDPQLERNEIRAILARGVDALLIASCQFVRQSFHRWQDQLTPMVLVDQPIPELRASFVGSDDFAGGRLATEHLIEIGRKRVAYIGSPDLGPGADRYRGFRHTMRDHHLEVRGDFVLSNPAGHNYSDEVGYEMMRRILRGRSKPDGVFCHNDVIAIGAMRAAMEAGLAVPADVAFVGFDNVHYSRYLHIPLTSVDQRAAEIGEAAALLALELTARKITNPKRILLEPTLVVRQSSVDAATAARLSAPSKPSPRERVSSTRMRDGRPIS